MQTGVKPHHRRRFSSHLTEIAEQIQLKGEKMEVKLDTNTKEEKLETENREHQTGSQEILKIHHECLKVLPSS